MDTLVSSYIKYKATEIFKLNLLKQLEVKLTPCMTQRNYQVQDRKERFSEPWIAQDSVRAFLFHLERLSIKNLIYCFHSFKKGGGRNEIR